ncbi:MAG TPA: hypothetical protein PLO23_01330 [Alphaproteobacteria bacterium]|nr:hypothetical protein [Alphaproteobacteria bacterium]
MRILTLILCLFIALPAFAQDDADKRLELAKKMHELRPTKTQVMQAIEVVSQRVPEDKRAAFEGSMMGAMDFKAIEKISIDAMTETFTVPELEAMVEYYSKPEAQSASDKLPDYQRKVGPEIIRMIDKAMMKVKTGQ